jgi:1-acyl-sn-glycerol-3-phosphate acyltransferase
LNRTLLANAIAAGARALTGATVQWIHCDPEPRQRIYFANHTSHLDFVVLWSVLPKEIRPFVRPVAAKDYWNSGWRRRIAVNVFNAVLVERHAHHGESGDGRHAVDILREVLDQDGSLIVFPEGTRGTGEVLGAFKSGIYHLWNHRPGVQLVPVYLSNLNRVLPRGEFLPLPVISRVVFGPPLQLEQLESKESFLKKAREAVGALREL